MNKTLRAKVMLIAENVRNWTEEKAFRTNYNPGDLCGWCAISAAQLFRELRKEKINAELHYVSGHCFVVVDDYIVDVTATQFSEFADKKINIIHTKEAEQYWFYTAEKVFTHPTQLRKYQLEERWPRRQIAYAR